MMKFKAGLLLFKHASVDPRNHDVMEKPGNVFLYSMSNLYQLFSFTMCINSLKDDLV